MDYDGYEEQNKVQFYRYEEVKNEKYNNVPADGLFNFIPMDISNEP